MPNPVPDPITIQKSDLIAPKSIEEVAPEKIFLSPGFQSVTIFAMGDPCQYMSPGRQAVRDAGDPGAVRPLTVSAAAA